MKRFLLPSFVLLLAVSGCVSPTPGRSVEVPIDSNPLGEAVTSTDVQTLASTMCPKILGVPEVASKRPARILTVDVKNSSRFLIDKNIFLKRLRLELNRYSSGRVRFIETNRNALAGREKVLRDRQEDTVRENLKVLGSEIASSPLIANAKAPVKIAVIPMVNTNLVNMNADGFAVMLRSEIVNAANGKVQFLMPGALAGADYYLAGQFIPESMKVEGVVNLLDYVGVVEERLKAGQSLDITDGRVPATANRNVPFVRSSASLQRESELVKLMRNPSMQANPNVNKRLNVMLVKPDTKVAVFEKMLLLDRRITDASGKADFILTCEISALSANRRGVASDTLLISVQVVDIESNEQVFEDAYEVKRVTDSGIVYQ